MLTMKNQNELIKITEANGKKAVSARDLHKFLESKQDFSNWINNRIKKYGLIENEDYARFNKIIETTGGRLVEYALTIDAAKELSMVEGNEKGSQARKYFIDIEKKYTSQTLDFSNPDVVLQLAQNWKEEQVKRMEAEKQVKKLEKKTEYLDRITEAPDMIDMGQAAKVLGLDFGRNTLFEQLRLRGIFFKNRNEPKQEYVERGFFVMKEKFIKRDNHPGFVVLQTLVTQKGLEFLAGEFEAKPGNKGLVALA